MEDGEAGMEEVVAEDVQVEGQFEDIAVETQVPSFVLDEMVSTLYLYLFKNTTMVVSSPSFFFSLWNFRS